MQWKRCPPELLAGYYWSYGPKKHSSGRTIHSGYVGHQEQTTKTWMMTETKGSTDEDERFCPESDSDIPSVLENRIPYNTKA